MFPKVAGFSEVAGGRPESDRWDSVRTSQWFEMAGRPEGIWLIKEEDFGRLKPVWSVQYIL
jgi:hypothetical protein